MAMLAAIPAALWLGILTAISPCPLATNLAAVSFIGRQVSSRKRAVVSGLLYTLGRGVAYVGVATVLAVGVTSVPTLSLALQKYSMRFMGPVLIVVGLFLLGWLGSTKSLTLGGQALHQRLAKAGPLGAFLLGVLFALSFCPASAWLFFGGLVPLSIKSNSVVLLPVVFGAGSALPVLVFALLVAFTAHHVGKAYNAMRRIEQVARIVTGAVFILAGVYLSLTASFGLSI